jgi:hypothetical protein
VVIDDGSSLGLGASAEFLDGGDSGLGLAVGRG